MQNKEALEKFYEKIQRNRDNAIIARSDRKKGACLALEKENEYFKVVYELALAGFAFLGRK